MTHSEGWWDSGLRQENDIQWQCEVKGAGNALIAGVSDIYSSLRYCNIPFSWNTLF
jgi:hypothetical protein